jgi:hypothetical protein
MTDADTALRALLLTLDPSARDALRRVLIHDQVDRDAICKLLGWLQAFVDGSRG